MNEDAHPKASPRLDNLLAVVRELTSQHGQKKALAAALGIHPTRLSEYLADPPQRRPNGETTLALLDWVAAAKKFKK